MNSYYIYKHIRPDTNITFYIGVGKEHTKRAWSKSGRNKHWKNIVSKNNGIFKYEFLFRYLTKEQAISREIELIEKYGRCNNNTGSLVNVLKGGQLQDIGPNYAKTWSEEIKKKMSKSHIGNISNTGKISITNGLTSTFIKKNGPIPEGWVLGTIQRKIYTKETHIRSSRGKKLNLSIEERAIRKQRALGNKACQGMIWITNGVESKLIKSQELILEGWYKGRHHITNPTGSTIKKKLQIINI